MKSKIKEYSEKSPYPYIGKHKNGDAIVLFTSENIGTILVEDNPNDIGEYRSDWLEDNFKRFSGEVILSN